nr:MAG TPA: hypothetical protein [Caudoviricetes sp.]
MKEFPDLKIGTVFQLPQKTKRKMRFGNQPRRCCIEEKAKSENCT